MVQFSSMNIRAARDQLGADILLRMYSRITGESLSADIQHPSQLSGRVITREQIGHIEYDDLSDLIRELRNVYSASGMRCLRSDAASRKSPVLNLIRQIARANGLGLISNRKPSGYGADGRKKFVYWYTFEALDGDYVPQPMLRSEILVSQGQVSSTNARNTTTTQRGFIEKNKDSESDDVITGVLILPDAN